MARYSRAALLLAITEVLKIIHEMFEAQTPSGPRVPRFAKCRGQTGSETGTAWSNSWCKDGSGFR
jgi:hypothetical protein